MNFDPNSLLNLLASQTIQHRSLCCQLVDTINELKKRDKTICQQKAQIKDHAGKEQKLLQSFEQTKVYQQEIQNTVIDLTNKHEVEKLHLKN